MINKNSIDIDFSRKNQTKQKHERQNHGLGVFMLKYTLITQLLFCPNWPNLTPQKNNGHRPAEPVAEAFALAEAEDLLRRQQSRAQLAPEGWHLDRGEEEMEFCSGETRRRKPRP